MKRNALSLWLITPALLSAAPDRDALNFFEKEVRPVLSTRCFECHGPEKKKGGLRLDFPEAILSGGDSGPALVPGKPDESLLVKAVRRTDHDLEMPPKKPLSAEEVTAFEKWVSLGAPWPESGATRPALVNDRFTEKERAWWAIQPLQNPVPPSPKGSWARNEIDRFVLAKLEASALAPAPAASRTELIRRASYDLLGLPPTQEQIQAFLADKRPDAWERLIDEFLSSPRYGERWAQHWLDVVRWAESDGYRQDAFRPEAWPYRDYVIASFNDDKPYDIFVKEQLAGDEIDRDNPDVLIATAYLRNGIYEYNQRDARAQRLLIVEELTSLTSEVFLGLGLGCAQCHDHKFDPLLQKDYYALQAFLAPVSWRFDLPRATSAEQKAHAEALAVWKAATKDLQAEIDTILEPRILKAQAANRKMFPEDIQAMIAKPREQRTPAEQHLVDLAEIQIRYERERFDERSIKGDEAARLQALRTRLAEFDPIKPKPLPMAFAATDLGPKAPEVLLKNRRGTTVIEPGFPTILNAGSPVLPTNRPSDSTGRRLALANWITQPDQPLSTRVIANRIWQHHFGTGLVATPNDFGTLGEPPSHPELLDWLTTRLVQGGWKMKNIHRLIMTSATYQQTARREPGESELLADPGNRLLWRFPPLRLDAEQIRDTMLSASGELLTGGITGSVDGGSPRRSIYVRKLRNSPDPVLAAFDLPLGFSSSPTRPSTTTPLQALLLANDEWPLQRARVMAQRLVKSTPDAAAVRRAYQALYSRDPEEREIDAALAFLSKEAGLAKSALGRVERFPGETGLRPIAQSFAKVKSAGLGGQALWLQPGSRFERLEASLPSGGDHFTVEAIAHLDAFHPDATVSTLVSRWNGNPLSPGWTLGVTGAKSKYKAGTVIVQLTGEDDQANTVYEVVPSGLAFPVGKPIYVSAEIRTPRVPSPGTGQTGTVTFHLRDLSDPAAVLQSVTVAHAVVSPPHSSGTRFIAGGRDQAGHLWDGQLARLRISTGGAPGAPLLQNAPVPTPLLDWTFASTKGDGPLPGTRWLRSAQPEAPSASSVATEAMTGFCHALLNSSEFLYLH